MDEERWILKKVQSQTEELKFQQFNIFAAPMVNIRRATIDDVPALYRLVKELAEFVKEPLELINTVEQMAEDGFGEKSLYEAFVATEGDAVIGMALFCITYSTWKGKIIYLEDLVVDASHRQSGAGTLLFNRLLEYCKEQDVNQLRWHVLDWNAPAINFYKKYNSSLDPAYITGKLTKEQIKEFTVKHK